MNDSPDQEEIAAMQHRRARLRLKAREIVAAFERGETVDPYSLEWAQFVDRHNRPAAGWLGDPEKTAT